uniref:DNA 3'-5' helicase n=1 Tax=Candidatus Kentrum sp. FW TaxID=2126338 RepID=A0A450SHR4_9GAMM|nr:MAG: DNA helicase-2 / ATP-dependent DNA helicase PcrA [Candidatus Kentron sp. FW]
MSPIFGSGSPDREMKSVKLNEQQNNAATYDGEAQNILVTAGAGCGKTQTIIARVVHLVRSGTDAARILMMTFTNRAAREMRSRLKGDLGPVSMRIQAGTFHSFCLKAMSRVPKSFGISGLNIIDSDDQNALITLVRGRHIDKREKEINKEFPRPPALIKYYSYSRNTCQAPKEYLASNTDLNKKFIKLCSRIFDEYQKEKEARGYLDYDDLLRHFANALEKKPELRRAVTGLFDEVLVDEMQDTNPLQFAILKHFSSEGVRLFCVGDPAQSIYRFRGAEFKHVYKFQEIFGNSTIIPLSLNYRSYQEILDLSNWLLDRSSLEYRNRLTAHRGKGDFLPLISDFESTQEEAGWIAGKILEQRERDIALNSMMVLVRTGFDAKPIEAEFIRREIPYHFIGGMSLTKAAHVRDVLSLLRIVRDERDDLAWMRFLKLWPRIGEKTAEKIIDDFHKKTDSKFIDTLAEGIGAEHNAVAAYKKTLSVQNTPKLCLFNAVGSLTPILKERYDKWDYRYQDLKLLITVAERYETVSAFIDAFTLEPMTNTEIEKSENDDAVLLVTVHSAKGTEAPICFVAGAKPGTYPHSRSYGEIDAEEEERRVLYVALTRAKNELFITRSMDHRSSFYLYNRPTEGEEYFLTEVPEELAARETHGWEQDEPGGLSSLEDVY